MAVTLYGDLAYIGIGKQSVQGTGVAPTKFFKITKPVTFLPVQVVTDFANGNQRDLNFALKESFVYKGTLTTLMYIDEAAAVLAWAMGKDTKTGAGDPYTHTLDLTVDALPYLSIETGYYAGLVIDRVVDCKISKVTINFVAGKEVEMVLELIGCSVAVQGSPTSVTFNDAAGQGPALYYHATLTLTGHGDASTTAGQIDTASIELDQGIVAVPGPGQITPIALFEQGRKVTIDFSAYFSSIQLHDYINYGGNAGAAVSNNVMTGSLEMLFTLQASPLHTVDLLAGFFNFHTDSMKVSADAKAAKIAAKAMGYRSGSNYPFSAVIKNGVSSAYV